jgi:hypothetical protein
MARQRRAGGLLPVPIAVLALAGMPVHAAAGSGSAESTDIPASGTRWHLAFSPYTYHYSHNPDHENVWLIGLERERADGALAGAMLFSNSFGQTSLFLYPWGRVYRDLYGVRGLYAKWSAGLLYGYREPYEDKVPLNHKGFSPGFIPALGYEFRGGQKLQVNVLAAAGWMIQFSIPIR